MKGSKSYLEFRIARFERERDVAWAQLIYERVELAPRNRFTAALEQTVAWARLIADAFIPHPVFDMQTVWSVA